MKRAAILTRCSTAEQADSRLGLDSQRRLCMEALARECPGKSFEEFTDAGVSGSVPIATRPAGRRLCDAIIAGEIDVVVALTTDRLFRDLIDSLVTLRHWDELGVRILLCDGGWLDTTSDESWLRSTIEALFAEYERRKAKKRTRRALRQVIDSGRHIGPPPLGMRSIVSRDEAGRKVNAGVHAIDSTEILAARRILDLAQTCGPVEIARRLTAEGVPTRHGGKWAHGQVQRVLARKERFAEVTV